MCSICTEKPPSVVLELPRLRLMDADTGSASGVFGSGQRYFLFHVEEKYMSSLQAGVYKHQIERKELQG